jgi:hypothetical protein
MKLLPLQEKKDNGFTNLLKIITYHVKWLKRNNMKIIISNTNVGALLKMADNVLKKYKGTDIPETIKGQATLSAIKNIFEKKFFSVCDLDEMTRMNEVSIPKEDIDFFRTLHCVYFEDMTQETREYLFAKYVNIFRGNIAISQSTYAQ